MAWQEKCACERFMQITFLRISRVSEWCTIIFNVSNALTSMWNKMMEEIAGVLKQNSKKAFGENEHACSVWGAFKVSDSTACQYLKLASPTWTKPSKSTLSDTDKQKLLTCSSVLGMSLRKVSYEAFVFSVFSRNQEKRSHWPGGSVEVSQLWGSTIAIIFAYMPGQHMCASSGPDPILQNSGSQMVALRFTTRSARVSHWRNPRKKKL